MINIDNVSHEKKYFYASPVMDARYNIADSLSLRHLKAALRVSEVKNLSQAAQSLNRSQTALTKGIGELEKQLGVKLFERSVAGMRPTAYGEIFARRTKSALEEFSKAGHYYLHMNNDHHRSIDNISVFTMDISRKRLNAFLALYDFKDAKSAADRVGITTAAVYNTTREIERLLNVELFQRNPGGVLASEFASVLAQHIKLAFAEIRHAVDELESASGGLSGEIVIGASPSAQIYIVPRTMERIHRKYQDLVVRTRSGSYHDLELFLRCADVDLFVHALHQDIHPELENEKLFDTSLCIVGRKDHPLANRETVTPEELNNLSWILPPSNPGSRSAYETVLNENGITEVDCKLETMYFTVLRDILMETNYVGLLFRHQFDHESRYGMLVELPVKLANASFSIGITKRANATLSPGVQMFIDTLRGVVAELR